MTAQDARLAPGHTTCPGGKHSTPHDDIHTSDVALVHFRLLLSLESDMTDFSILIILSQYDIEKMTWLSAVLHRMMGIDPPDLRRRVANRHEKASLSRTPVTSSKKWEAAYQKPAVSPIGRNRS